jgi:anti-sigma factor RsiW
MTEMTHQEVRNLLQSAADKALPPKEKILLARHISACAECRTYENELDELQSGLSHILKQRWGGVKPAFSARLIKERSRKAAVQARRLATFGKLAVIPVLAFAFFIIYMASGPQRTLPAVNASTIPMPGAALNTPTPPAHSTATQPAAQNCDRVSYLIQENDTLDDIAARFSVSKEVLRSFNGMSSDDLSRRTELIIPLCQSTSTPTITSTSAP